MEMPKFLGHSELYCRKHPWTYMEMPKFLGHLELYWKEAPLDLHGNCPSSEGIILLLVGSISGLTMRVLRLKVSYEGPCSKQTEVSIYIADIHSITGCLHRALRKDGWEIFSLQVDRSDKTFAARHKNSLILYHMGQQSFVCPLFFLQIFKTLYSWEVFIWLGRQVS